MRHKISGKRLGRTSEHRRAMRRNLVCSLLQHETISTTKQKAKEVRAFAEKLITLAKKGNLAARRRAIALLGGDRDIVEEDDGVIEVKGTIVNKLFSELAPRYLERPGGYTRIVRLALRRLGDNGERVLLQLVGADEKIETKKKTKRKEAAIDVSEQIEAADEDAVQADVKMAEGEDPGKVEETTGNDKTEDDAPEKKENTEEKIQEKDEENDKKTE